MGDLIVPLDKGLHKYPSGIELYRTPKNVGGRPPGSVSYNDKLANRILFRLANGESLLDIVEDEVIDFSTVMSWNIDNEHGFGLKYARARLSGCYHINEQMIRIADDSRNDWMFKNDPDNPGWRFNGDHLFRTRLRLDQRKFFLAKICPKLFGDKLKLDERPENEFAEPPAVDVDQMTGEQLQAIETAALACAAVGVRIKIVGLDKVSA